MSIQFDQLLREWLVANAPQCTIQPIPADNSVQVGFVEPDVLGIESWGANCGPQPTDAEILAFEQSPEWKAHLVAKRAAQLAVVRSASMDARRAQTWPNMSAGEVSEAIAMSEPSAGAVAAYSADRATINSEYTTAVAALDAMTAEQLWDAIQGAQ